MSDRPPFGTAFGVVPNPLGLRDARAATLSRNWWALALRGVFAIVFGLIALAAPGLAIATLLLLFAAYMLVDGVFAILAGVRAASHHERWMLLIVEGVLDLLAATVAYVLPGLSVVLFVTLVAVWAIVSGVALLAAGSGLHASHGRVWLFLAGAVSLGFGVLLLFAPLLGAVVLATWLGIYALLFGITMLAFAMRLRRAGRL